MPQKKLIAPLSLSLASVASGAFASIGDITLPTDTSKQTDLPEHNFELGALASGSFHVDANTNGVKYAKRYNPSFVGSSATSGAAGSGVEGCYSNCHTGPVCHTDTIAQCVASGYTQSTACASNYIQVSCPANSARWRCDCHNDSAQQCIDAGYATTACSANYTKSYCTQNSSYWKCVCHTDSCPTLKTNTDNARAALVTAITGPKASKGTISGLSNVSGVFTLSTTPYASDATDANNIISMYNSYNSAASTYNASCSPAYSNAYSCYSNCHSEACDSYLNSQGGVSVVMSDADITTAMASSNDTVAVLANVSLPDNINLGTKKLVGPKYFTASSLCTSMSTPTLTSPGKTIDLGSSGTIKQLGLNFSGGSYSTPYIAGSGTVDTVDITNDGQGIMFNLDGKTMNLNGTINIDGTFKSGSCTYTKLLNGSKMYVNGPLNISGSAAMTFALDNASTFQVKSTGNLKYTASGWWNLFESKNQSTMIFDGPITMPSMNPGGNTNYVNGFYQPFYVIHNSKLYLNASGNTIKGIAYGIYASGPEVGGGVIEINGSTTIELNHTSQKIAFKIDHGNYYDPTKYNVNINAPVTITGLNKYTGSYNLSQGDHMFYILDATLNVNSTISNTGTGGTLRNVRSSFKFNNGSYISGIDNVDIGIYNYTGGAPTLNIYTGAKIKIGSTCKKATANKTYSGSYTAIWTSPPAPYTGGC